MSSNYGLKIRQPISIFWIFMREMDFSVARTVLTILILFSTSYLGKLGFSSLTNNKFKKKIRY